MSEQFMRLTLRLEKARRDVESLESEVLSLARDIISHESQSLRAELQREWRALVMRLADAAIAADEIITET